MPTATYCTGVRSMGDISLLLYIIMIIIIIIIAVVITIIVMIIIIVVIVLIIIIIITLIITKFYEIILSLSNILCILNPISICCQNTLQIPFPSWSKIVRNAETL